MNERQRMEEFYDKYMNKEFRVFMVWEKDGDGEYVAPLSQLLWAGWQAAQHGQRSFDFGNERKSEFFGDR
jgi:hypothetical protein